jgi:hypothetical protein
MVFGNIKKIDSQERLKKSVQDEFTYFALKDEILEQYGLSKRPCPVRFFVLEGVFTKGTIEFTTLAEECIAYRQQYPENKQDVAELLLRLCYLADLNAGQAV